jgi:hypothetical protein
MDALTQGSERLSPRSPAPKQSRQFVAQQRSRSGEGKHSQERARLPDPWQDIAAPPILRPHGAEQQHPQTRFATRNELDDPFRTGFEGERSQCDLTNGGCSKPFWRNHKLEG